MLEAARLLETFFKQGRHDPFVQQAAVTQAWYEAMPPSILAKTQACFVRNKLLFVRVASSTLRHELRLTKPRIWDKLCPVLTKYGIVDILFI